MTRKQIEKYLFTGFICDMIKAGISFEDIAAIAEYKPGKKLTIEQKKKILLSNKELKKKYFFLSLFDK